MLDVVPPAAVTLTLTSDGAAVAPGGTIRTAGAALELGLDAQQRRQRPGVPTWCNGRHRPRATVTTVITSYPSGFAGRAVYGRRGAAPGSAGGRAGQLRQPALAGRSAPSTWTAPETPDYIQLEAGGAPYSGWLDSGCSLLGIDHRGEQTLGGRGPQQLYATWDQQALRLAWTGANWNNDGDLFIYLDTRSRRCRRSSLQPAIATGRDPAISLPVGMAADALIWVHDSRTRDAPALG